ncbi:hypothetical protein AB0F93_03420 [Micromonospora tulbaghiae]|uniref:hypothetical protein n=1 Tax=Micromonospora tulbaghiae TaxID=479978 RepID=UPI00331AD011
MRNLPARVDVYPVGVLEQLLRLRRAVRAGRPELVRWALRGVRVEVAAVAGDVRRGRWREAKNRLNGYLAEPTPFPAELTRCGSGWTRKRAVASLHRHGYRPPVDRCDPASGKHSTPHRGCILR